jgi:hypothetical protein
LTLFPAHYYDRTLPQEYIQDLPGSGSDTLALPTQKALGLLARTGPEEGVSDARRVWFVIFKKEIDEYRAMGSPTHPHLEWLEKNFHLDRSEDWGEMTIYVFSR